MVYRKPLFKEIAVLSVLVAGLHIVALRLFLYWTTDWFDIPMHFLGGFLIGLILIFIFHTSGIIAVPVQSWRQFGWLIIAGVFVVGLGWEVWELLVGFTDVITDVADTLLDIVMDLLGGGASLLYAQSLLWNKQNK